MKVIVTGSRSWPDTPESVGTIHQALLGTLHLASAMGEPLTVVHGNAATGVDRIADRWTHGQWSPAVIPERHPADWRQYGKAAGPRRNSEMAQAGAQLCLAFLHEPEEYAYSAGTRNMMQYARIYGIPVLKFHWKEESK